MVPEMDFAAGAPQAVAPTVAVGAMSAASAPRRGRRGRVETAAGTPESERRPPGSGRRRVQTSSQKEVGPAESRLEVGVKRLSVPPGWLNAVAAAPTGALHSAGA